MALRETVDQNPTHHMAKKVLGIALPLLSLAALAQLRTFSVSIGNLGHIPRRLSTKGERFVHRQLLQINRALFRGGLVIGYETSSLRCFPRDGKEVTTPDFTVGYAPEGVKRPEYVLLEVGGSFTTQERTIGSGTISWSHLSHSHLLTNTGSKSR